MYARLGLLATMILATAAVSAAGLYAGAPAAFADVSDLALASHLLLPVPAYAQSSPEVPASFVEPGSDPQSYVDRYKNEPAFRDWFDANHPDYDSIYHAVGLPEVPASFVEPGTDPQSYVDRYNNEPAYEQWFEDNHSEYDSIYHAVGLPEPDSAAGDPTAAVADPTDEPAAAAPAGGGDNGDPAADAPPEEAAAPQTRELPRLDVPLAPFVDEAADPQEYVDRYNSDASYREWFDANYAAEYGTIYRAVGLLDVPAQFVEPGTDPQTYVDRYNSDASYREWFDDNYGEYLSIYHAVGLSEPEGGPVEPEAPPLPPPVIAPGAVVPPGLELQPGQEFGECGEGTELQNGYCVIIGTEPPPPPPMTTPATSGADKEDDSKDGGGCLIATAAYGTEMAPQVQMLREIRDAKLVQTNAGESFVGGFNTIYYSFSPHVADYQRENPVFRDAVRTLLTPLLYTLGIMEHADSEQEVLGYGIIAILASMAMYVGVPAASTVYSARYVVQRRGLLRGAHHDGGDRRQ